MPHLHAAAFQAESAQAIMMETTSIEAAFGMFSGIPLGVWVANIIAHPLIDASCPIS